VVAPIFMSQMWLSSKQISMDLWFQRDMLSSRRKG